MAMRDSVTVSMSGRDNGDIELQRFGEDGFQFGVAREDFRVKRGEGEVVKRQADVALSREKRVGVFVKLGVEVSRLRCHDRR